MNEEDDEDLIGLDPASGMTINAPRMSGKNSILNSDHRQSQTVSQRWVNMPTTGFVPDFSYDAYTLHHPIDTFASAPRRPDFEKIRDHLVEDLEHVFTYDEKFGDVIAMPKAIAQALLNYLNWEISRDNIDELPFSDRRNKKDYDEALNRVQRWLYGNPSQVEIEALRRKMPPTLSHSMFPFVKLLDELDKKHLLR